MGDDSENEELENEEEEEVEVFTPIDTSEMPDGERTWVLGGWSALKTTAEAMEQLTSTGNKRLLVCEGAYDQLDLPEAAANAVIVGVGDAAATVFEGATASVSVACVENVSFKVDPKSSCCLRVECEKAKCCKVAFTACAFSGGKRVVEVHPYARPTFAACSVRTEGTCGLYCFPRSRPTFQSACTVLRATPLLAGKQPADKPLATIPAGERVAVLSVEAPTEEGAKLLRVTWKGALPVLSAAQQAAAAAAQNAAQVVPRFYEGYVARAAVDWTQPVASTIEGTGGKAGGTGVFADDSALQLHDVRISAVETAVCMREPCADSLLDGCRINDVAGTGIHCSGGCRTVCRGVWVSGCTHYALQLAAGTQPASDPISQLCQRREEAKVAGDAEGVKQIDAALAERGVVLNEGERTWTEQATKESGHWGPAETRSIFRECVFLSAVRLHEGTAGSFFGSSVVAPAKLNSAVAFAVNGLALAAEAPKQVVLQRDEEEEG